MKICPNCSYELVLLSSRLKYKCALCYKLYPQKYIDNKTFREWNQRQRELDLHTLKLENQKRREILTERRILRAFRFLFNNLKSRDIHSKNKILRRGQRIKLFDKYPINKIYLNKLKKRLSYWRNKQKRLALQFLKTIRRGLLVMIFFKLRSLSQQLKHTRKFIKYQK